MTTQSPRAATSGPQTQRKRPGDLTGVNSQKLAADRDEAKEAAAAAEEAARQATRVEKVSTVVDYTENGRGQRDQVTEVETPDEPRPEFMVIRVNYPIEDMTFGKEVISHASYDGDGRLVEAAVLGSLLSYTFEEGQEYKVPWELGLHLKRLGYVYSW